MYKCAKLYVPRYCYNDWAVKIGPKHTDYNTTRTNDIVEAALRRDLTINAMFLTMSGSILDPMDGMPHLKAGVLHPTSDRFLEDSLRVLRVFQLASRLDFFPSQSLIEISRRALDDFSYLSKERIGEEWWKWATKSINPERGLQYLLDCGALERFYPSLFAMTTTPQNPKWHPEGSVWIHTLKALGAVKHYVLPVQDRVALIFSVLLHDIGKPITTEFDEEGRLMSKDHAHAAISQHLISDFAKAIRMPGSIENMVEVLVDTHMSKIQEMGKPGIRRLARKLEEKGANIGLHLRLRQCDRIGQGLSEVEAHQEFVENWERAESFLVGLHSPVPVLMGRHLIEAGLVDPGPTMGRILKMVFELQLDGEVETVEQGLEKAKEILTASE